jgi:hypothetical protein
MTISPPRFPSCRALPYIGNHLSVTVSVRTVQAGPMGTMTTQSQTVEPGFGKTTSSQRRPQTELQIRYGRKVSCET